MKETSVFNRNSATVVGVFRNGSFQSVAKQARFCASASNRSLRAISLQSAIFLQPAQNQLKPCKLSAFKLLSQLTRNTAQNLRNTATAEQRHLTKKWRPFYPGAQFLPLLSLQNHKVFRLHYTLEAMNAGI